MIDQAKSQPSRYRMGLLLNSKCVIPEFTIIVESESKIYIKEYGEGDDEEWEEGTTAFSINAKVVHIPPALLGMTRAQLNKRLNRPAR